MTHKPQDKKADARRYYLHRIIKAFPAVVHSRRKTIDIAQNVYDALKYKQAARLRELSKKHQYSIQLEMPHPANQPPAEHVEPITAPA